MPSSTQIVTFNAMNSYTEHNEQNNVSRAHKTISPLSPRFVEARDTINDSRSCLYKGGRISATPRKVSDKLILPIAIMGIMTKTQHLIQLAVHSRPASLTTTLVECSFPD